MGKQTKSNDVKSTRNLFPKAYKSLLNIFNYFCIFASLFIICEERSNLEFFCEVFKVYFVCRLMNHMHNFWDYDVNFNFNKKLQEII